MFQNRESLIQNGKNRVEWARRRMPVLSLIKQEFANSKPLRDETISACLHVTSETANLVLTLKEWGAKVFLAASNPLSTQDDVAEYLRNEGIEVFAKAGEDAETYHRNIEKIIEAEPDILIDDGADAIAAVHQKFQHLSKKIRAGLEETTTGVIRIKSLEKSGELKIPIIAVNDAKTKNLFDNRYGTGQSSLDGVLRATNILFSGKKVVVAGYGWCGKGVAMKAKGLGARVIVVEADPIKALEAAMDGYEVYTMEEASKIGDVFITVTGNTDVIRWEHIEKMKDGVILANAGHFDVEIDVKTLYGKAVNVKQVRDNLEEIDLGSKKVYLLAKGRLVNLVAAEGHPSEVMDMSFSTQALSVLYALENQLEVKVHNVPHHIEEKIATLKLKTMGYSVEKLTEKQIKYLNSWKID